MPGTEAPEQLEEKDRTKLLAWALDSYPTQPAATILELADECLDWHRAKGRRCKDWLAACRNWIRKEQRMKRERLAASLQRGAAVRVDANVDTDRWERYRLRTGHMHPDDPRTKRQQRLPGVLLSLTDRVGRRLD